MDRPMNIAVLGAGGLGKAAAKILAMKNEMRLVGICDRSGFAFDPNGLDGEAVAQVKIGGSVADLLGVGHLAEDSIGEVLQRADAIDGVLVALPNLPNSFIPGVIRRFTEAGFAGSFVDALKRTTAMEMMFELDADLKLCESAYITGCGATPGLLTAAAVIAAQSFVNVEKVDIWWGVGIANWDEYRATIREDIAHLPGYDVEKAKAMTDEQVDGLLDKTDGILELHEMEHADDLLLERVGVVDSKSQVEVGGVMDTRHARKPVSTTMTLTGITYEGKRSSHKFVLGDETTMAANVIGPALGYLKRAAWLRDHGIYGMFGSTEMMPCVVR